MEDLILEKIKEIVRNCGSDLLNAQRDTADIFSKEGHANFVTTYDRAIQEKLRKELLKIVPDAIFIGEEEDIHPDIGKGYAFLVDPIDGTTNFIRDFKQSCISIALLKDNTQMLGVIYNPYLDEMYSAEKGKGAYLNGNPIKVSDRSLEDGIVIIGTAPYYKELNQESFDLAYRYFQKALDIRRSGSSALDLCNVAAGRAEVFSELRLSPWDYAAGSLIVKEAGGIVTTIGGEKLKFDSPCPVLATNGVVEEI